MNGNAKLVLWKGWNVLLNYESYLSEKKTDISEDVADISFENVDSLRLFPVLWEGFVSMGQ